MKIVEDVKFPADGHGWIPDWNVHNVCGES